MTTNETAPFPGRGNGAALFADCSAACLFVRFATSRYFSAGSEESDGVADVGWARR